MSAASRKVALAAASGRGVALSIPPKRDIDARDVEPAATLGWTAGVAAAVDSINNGGKTSRGGNNDLNGRSCSNCIS